MSGLLLIVWAVVTLYMVIDRFSESYGDREEKNQMLVPQMPQFCASSGRLVLLYYCNGAALTSAARGLS